MKKVIYPGTFDPITFGHIDLIKKALNIFDNLIIAISDGNNKEYLFSAEEISDCRNLALPLCFACEKIYLLIRNHSLAIWACIVEPRRRSSWRCL